MTAVRMVALWCDGDDGDNGQCQEEYQGDAVPVTEVRDAARESGWVFYRRKDYCPNHRPIGAR